MAKGACMVLANEECRRCLVVGKEEGRQGSAMVGKEECCQCLIMTEEKPYHCLVGVEKPSICSMRSSAFRVSFQMISFPSEPAPEGAGDEGDDIVPFSS